MLKAVDCKQFKRQDCSLLDRYSKNTTGQKLQYHHFTKPMLFLQKVVEVLEPISQLSLDKRQGTYWTGRQPVAGLTYSDRQLWTLTYTPIGNLKSPVATGT